MASFFGVVGCASGPERNDISGGGKGAPTASEPCKDGEARRCSIHVDQENGVVSCYEGVSYCDDGNFGDCVEGTIVKKPLALPGRSISSVSAGPVSCNNTCDPTCQEWIEGGPIATGVTPPNYPGYPGGTACGHSLCTTGAALTSSCDACVASVCAADPSCCDTSSGSWDQLCVEEVYSICLNQTKPYSLCDFGIFSASSNQFTMTGLSSSSAISVGSLGNVTVSSGKNVRRIITKGPVYLSSPELPPLGVLAGDDITVNASSVNSPIGSLESGKKISMYGYPRVNGDVKARGDVVWETKVYGNILAGGNVNLAGGCAGSVVGGTCTNASTHAAPTFTLPTLPAQSFSCGGANYNVNPGGITLSPGNYGDVYVEQTLVLSAPGTYNFNRLYARTIQLPVLAAGQRVNIEVCNEFNVMTNGKVVDSTGTLLADPTKLFVSVKGNLHFDSNVDWVGVVEAASSGTKSGGSIRGAIWASPVNDLNGQTSIVGLSESECISMGIPGTTPPMCPINPVSSPTPPALSTPCASGLDCQINHRCSEPKTAAACGHSKCLPGGALTASCDPCVARICADTPSCCSSNWSAACVAKVANVCDAVCAPVTGGGCSAALCSAPPSGASVCDFAVHSDGSTTVSAGSSVGVRPKVVGDVGAKGAVSLYWADVGGNVYLNGAFGPVASTYGTAENQVQPTLFVDSAPTCSGASGTPSSGAIPPGNYGAVVVPAGATLTLSEGNYTFQSLTLAAQSAGNVATLALPTSGAVKVSVCGMPNSVVFGAGSKMTGLTQATAMSFTLHAEGTITMNGAKPLFGFFETETNASLTDSTIYGIVSSKNTVNVGAGTTIDASGQRLACFLAGHDSSVTADPITVSESGACVPNEIGYKDATCSSYDLALGVPCDSTVPVCNHGTTAFSGTAAVSYFADSAKKMATLTPGTPDGTCSASLTIAPGQCQSLTCSGLPASGLLTMMLDSAGTLAECGAEARRLDNWTVHDRRSCSAISTTRTFDYRATCTVPGTSPRWGLLTFATTQSATSSIDFSARLGAGSTPAAAAAAAAAKPFVPLVTANAALSDCPTSGPLPCPIDLTSSLLLGSSQGSHLDLRVTLTGTAASSPTLDDWAISYSCVYDQ